MKVVVLGDTHFGGGYALGKPHPSLKVNSRLIDFSNTFDYVIDHMINNNIKKLIITGDIFEHRKPQVYELAIFSEKVGRLRSLNIDVHIIIGNHDLIKEYKSTTVDALKELNLSNVYIYSDIGSASFDDLSFVFMPFYNKHMLNTDTNEEAVLKIKERVNFEYKKLTGYKVIIGHSVIQGTRLGNMLLDGNAGEVIMPLNMFNDFDGAVMGHVHPHQLIQRADPMIAYIGSMEKKDFSDSGLNKYFLIIDTESKPIFKFEPLPVRELYDVEIDKSDIENSDDLTSEVNRYITDFNINNPLKNNIIRLNLLINEKALLNLDKNIIKKHLYDLGTNYCVGIFTTVVSARQLRKASITERNDPLITFYDYLELESDLNLREKMRQIGTKIITGKIEEVELDDSN
jgi:DNA repair exonuclease SbcCD nuclease subunit